MLARRFVQIEELKDNITHINRDWRAGEVFEDAGVRASCALAARCCPAHRSHRLPFCRCAVCVCCTWGAQGHEPFARILTLRAATVERPQDLEFINTLTHFQEDARRDHIDVKTFSIICALAAQQERVGLQYSSHPESIKVRPLSVCVCVCVCVWSPQKF